MLAKPQAMLEDTKLILTLLALQMLIFCGDFVLKIRWQYDSVDMINPTQEIENTLCHVSPYKDKFKKNKIWRFLWGLVAQLDSRSHHKSLWALLTYFSTSSSKTVRRACLGETGRIAEDFQCQTASSFSPDDIIGFHGATIAWWISDLKQGHMCYIRRFTQLH